ncbi:4a-hydroxytetrahydrobiopterin dehydratase [Actinoplanes bogorensis]|uniref:4a-hydroxytetrahydrobiopterin dehydratase n=1 Tax=Paractinoplanes bogorensis TaxID=1610840 RepID=A0ABS5YPT0_9ACTN|nr:VOC family protein [Actinoplanes bogorensis]MBU2665326.1 4a-hydroxytetrahydrobiopterin dehydratase [Actinoplanes bogorensis]
MAETMSRVAASAAVSDLGWRYLLGALRASVPVGSLFQAASVAAGAVAACGPDADDHLSVGLRSDRVLLTLTTGGEVTALDVDLARRITGMGMPTEPGSLRMLEIAIDALDIPAVWPFWRAVLGYTGDPGDGGPAAQLIDPAGEGPVVWFQQMDEPRPQRNRIHVDITVAHDEAAARIEAALNAGGRLMPGSREPAFWILADPEGNEACICTWQGREP